MSFVLSTVNYVDDPSVTITSSLGMVSGMGLDQLRRRFGPGIARTSTDSTTWTLNLDLGYSRPVDAIGAMGANVATDQAFVLQVLASNVSMGGTDVGNMTFNNASAAERVTRGLVTATSSRLVARYWRLVFTYTNDAAYSQMWRLWLGPGFRKSIGVDLGWINRKASAVQIERADSEQPVADSKVGFRKFILSVSNIAQDDAYGINDLTSDHFMDAQLSRMKAGNDLVACINAADPVMQQRASMYGHLATGAEPDLVAQGPGIYKAGPVELWQVPLR